MTRTWILLLGLALAIGGCLSDADDDVGDDDATADDDDATADDDDTTPGDDDDVGDDDDDDDDVTFDPCTFADPSSAFVDVYELYTGGAWNAYVNGRVGDAPWPQFNVVDAEDGSCRYLSFAMGHCEPACNWDEVCTPADVCEAYPTGMSAGVLTVDGLAVAVKVEPEEWSPGYYYGPWDLPDDLFGPGDAITATFAGADFSGAALQAMGVAPMDTDLADDGLELLDGGDVEVTWIAGPNPDACVEVVINGINQAHGLPLMDIIECVGTDTGSMVLPQALVEAFPHGLHEDICVSHDCPPSEITRFTRQTVDTASGPVQLHVHSTVTFSYIHEE